MLTRSHVNPIANIAWQLLRTAVLQDSVQGHLFCALPFSIRPDKGNLQSIKGYYSQKLPHLCEGRFIAACVAGRAVLQQFLITSLLFSQLFARCLLQSLSVSFIVLQQIIRNHWKIINPLNQPAATGAQRGGEEHGKGTQEYKLAFPQTSVNMCPSWKPVRNHQFQCY